MEKFRNVQSFFVFLQGLLWKTCTFAFWLKHSAGGSSVDMLSVSPLAMSSSSLTSSVRVSSTQTSRPPIFLAFSKIFPFSSCNEQQHRHYVQCFYTNEIDFKFFLIDQKNSSLPLKKRLQYSDCPQVRSIILHFAVLQLNAIMHNNLTSKILTRILRSIYLPSLQVSIDCPESSNGKRVWKL